MDKKSIEALARAYQEVTEKLVGGQKELDQDDDGDIDKHDFAALRAKKKKKGKDDPQGEKGETATMNPKMEKQATAENVRSADKKPEVFVGPDGKKHTRMVPVDREVVKKESTDMSIRDKLMSVLEKKDHGHTDMKQPYDDNWSPGAKEMEKGLGPRDFAIDGEKVADETAKSIANSAKVAPKNSTDKSAPGDKNILKGKEMKNESFSSMIKNMANAYKEMYAPKEETEIEESFKHYTVTHKPSGKKYKVTAMSDNSAKDKARQMHGGSASRYSGTSSSDFHIESYVANGETLEEAVDKHGTVTQPAHTSKFAGDEHYDGSKTGEHANKQANISDKHAMDHHRASQDHEAAAAHHIAASKRATSMKSGMAHLSAADAHKAAAKAHDDAHYNDATHHHIHMAHHMGNYANDMSAHVRNYITKKAK